MENTLAIGEYAGAEHGPTQLRREVAPRLLAESPTVSRLTCYRRLDGPAQYDFWLLAELTAPPDVAATARQVAATGARTRGYHEVFRMARTQAGTPRQVSCSALVETTPDHILTVVLPVPANRATKWNRWYDESHMPTVFEIAPAIQVGHRLAPVTAPSDGSFLVIYEFASRESLDAWQHGPTVTAKRDEYASLWGVRNTRRAFTVEFRLDRAHAMDRAHAAG